MEPFVDMEEVEEWLEPLDYRMFWKEIARFELDLEPRESCDAQIASHSIDEKTVLFVLKGMARLQLVERFHLRPRASMPFDRIH
jgi:hypothetical protein